MFLFSEYFGPVIYNQPDKDVISFVRSSYRGIADKINVVGSNDDDVSGTQFGYLDYDDDGLLSYSSYSRYYYGDYGYKVTDTSPGRSDTFFHTVNGHGEMYMKDGTHYFIACYNTKLIAVQSINVFCYQEQTIKIYPDIKGIAYYLIMFNFILTIFNCLLQAKTGGRKINENSCFYFSHFYEFRCETFRSFNLCRYFSNSGSY